MRFQRICAISLKLRVEPVVFVRRLRILRALIAFYLPSEYPAKHHAFSACRLRARSAQHCKYFAGGFVDYVRRFFLQAISASSLAVSSSITTNKSRSRIFSFHCSNEMKCTACCRAEINKNRAKRRVSIPIFNLFVS